MDKQTTSILAQAAKPQISIAALVALYGQPGIIKPVEPVVEQVIFPQLEPRIAPAPWVEYVITPATQAIVQPQTETRVSDPAIEVAPVLQEQVVEEAVEEIELQLQDTEIKDEEGEKISEVKIQRVADEVVIRQRVSEIIEAAKKADSLDGENIIRFLPGQHQKNRSGELNIVDPGGRLVDGSLLALFKRIATFKFTSLIDVYIKAPKIVREDIPVTQGEGEVVTDKDVAKVYEPNKRKAPPAQEVIQPPQNEGTIQDLGLAEVFNSGLTDSNSLG